MVYPSGVYRTLASRLEDTKAYRSEQNACIALAVAKVYQDCLANQTMFGSQSPSGYLLRQASLGTGADRAAGSLGELPQMVPYQTARIDITWPCDGGGIDVEEVSDPFAEVSSPSWLRKRGGGRVVQSRRGISC